MRSRTVALGSVVALGLGLGVAAATLLRRGAPPAPAPAEAHCCQRDIYTPPFTLPAGVRQDWSRFFATGAGSPLHSKLASTACPLEVWLTGNTQTYDYLFQGEVTTRGLTQVDHEGNLRGNFVAHLRLVDPDHGNAVLREADPVTWTGTITDGLNHMIYRYEPSTGAVNPSWEDPAGELGKQFTDIDRLIYDYERKPMSAKAELPERSRDRVAAGDVVTVTVSDIFDHEKRPTKEWQRVLVEPAKGTILDAPENWGDKYHVFRAGPSARVDMRYQAPTECKAAQETLTFYNTCVKKQASQPSGTAGDEIATKSFDIFCDRWQIRITYTEEMTDPGGTGGAPYKGSRSFSQTLVAELHRAEPEEKPEWDRRFYEATTARVDLEDRFQQITDNEGKHVVAGWHGQKHGQMNVPVQLSFDDADRTLHLDLGVATASPPVWKTTFQWSGFGPIPDGACEMSDATSDGFFSVGTGWLTDAGEPVPFQEGQNVIGGRRSWSEIGSESAFMPGGRDYASANCPRWGTPLPGFAAPFFTLATASLTETRKALTWEIRRLGSEQ